MTPKPRLHAVPDEPEQPTDITALNRAEIEWAWGWMTRSNGEYA